MVCGVNHAPGQCSAPLFTEGHHPSFILNHYFSGDHKDRILNVGWKLFKINLEKLKKSLKMNPYRAGKETFENALSVL